MKSVREKVTFCCGGLLYLLFNLKIAATWQQSFVETLLQIVRCVPVVAGLTCILVAVAQYMANGVKMPWERRFRIFFVIGIAMGLLYAIYESAGKVGS